MTELKGKKKVTVFGAGVAGLTAAHELVERGFEVEIIDPDIREEVHALTFDRGIGGMARSQWACTIPESESGSRTKGVGAPPVELRHAADVLLDDVIVFTDGLTGPAHGSRTDPGAPAKVLDRAAALVTQLLKKNQLARLCVVAPQAEPLAADALNLRVEYVKNEIATRLKIQVSDLAKLRTLSWPVGDTPEMQRWAFFHIPTLDTFPAEHGFRFFPSFYRHLFDTLKRIRIGEPRPHERASLNVMNNLLPSEGLAFARNGKAESFVIPRKPMTSLETIRRHVDLVLRQLEYSLSDIERFGSKILKYMTSSSARRAGQYETLSWGRFVEQEKYSEVSRRHIEFGPQMSAALRGSESDARTQGNITVQLMTDQLQPSSHTDSTLNGPTSSAWFDHWHNYLLEQGVSFRRGKLTGFVKDCAGIVRPELDGIRYDATDVYILALSLPAMVPLAQTFIKVAESELKPGNDFEKILAFAGGAGLLQDLEKENPSGPLQHLSGIQYYFDADLRFWRGHTQYLDSEWGLTSIAQPQFWGRDRNVKDGYRSILSVDIGIWNLPCDGKTAWACNAQQIADRAWKQIKDHHDNNFRKLYGQEAQIPEPIAFAFDQNIEIGELDGLRDVYPKKDHSAFLVNRVGAFDRRPGKLIANGNKTPVERETAKQKAVYDVPLRRYVLAGTYMKTYTRLTSMEAANESARHAVNALLTTLEVAGDHCQIWDPEDNELPGLQWLRDLDQRLYEGKRPHFMDIVGHSRGLDASLMARFGR